MKSSKLSKLQKHVLTYFGRNAFGQNFYWTGGTLLSYLYLQHRLSVDLDFFSDNLFSDDEYLIAINNLKKEVGAEKITLTSQQNRRLYLIKRDKEAIKFELVYFPFPAVGQRNSLPEFSFKADSLVDIMTNKILSTYERNEVKDVFDLYCYLSNRPKYNLIKLISLVEKKFGVAVEPAILFSKINELAGNLDSLSPLLLKPQKGLTKKVKVFFQNIFNSFAKKKIK